jgi:hypothetical protein
MDKETRDAVVHVLNSFFKNIAVVAFGGIAISTNLVQLIGRSFGCTVFLVVAMYLETYQNKNK